MKAKIYEDLKQMALACKKCDLGCKVLEGYDPHVFVDGNLNAKIMFVSEAPEKQETIAKECLTIEGKSGKTYKKNT